MKIIVNKNIEVEWDGQISKCKSCGADIGWGITKAGKKMPFDADKTFQRCFERNANYFVISHFGTCPDAAKFSKKGKK